MVARTVDTTAAVVIFSGGADSACVASMQKAEYDEIHAITFSYGQRAAPEIDAARILARKLKLKQHKVVDIGFMGDLYGDSNVLTGGDRLPGSFDYSIVVPIRNAVFLSIATAWAFSIGATRVAYGAHTGDTNYPDCRPPFAKKLQDALNEGESDGIAARVRKEIEIWSPFTAGLSKEDLLRYGKKTLGDSIYETWSCYDGGGGGNNASSSKNDNAEKILQCGACESCMNRRRAFAAAGIDDKTVYYTSV